MLRIYYLCGMDWRQYRDTNRIVMFEALIEDEHLDASYPIVDANGVVIAYYVPDGYDVVSAYLKKFKGVLPRSALYRVCYSLVWLNPELDFEVLLSFVVLYADSLSDIPYYKVRENEIRGMLDFCYSTLDESVKSSRKFYWTNATGFLPLEEKMKVMNSYKGGRQCEETIRKVENVLEWLFMGSDFITQKKVAEKSGLHRSTVASYLEPFKDGINRHNIRIWNTDNFNTYRRTLSVHNIKRAIEVLNDTDEKISQTRVANVADIHLNTVSKLWGDDEVQDLLNKFNMAYERT